MKFYRHPKINLTTIQTKDGALYTKRWLFFKPVLPLEIDLTFHRLWQLEGQKNVYDKNNKNITKLFVNTFTNNK